VESAQPAVEVRRLTDQDLPQALDLSALIGWNQTIQDWQRLLTIAPDGCFCAWIGEQLVGTATRVIYHDTLAWVGMVLVHPEFRRKGIATLLLNECHRAPKLTYKLDATEAGQKVYELLGYSVETKLGRWVKKQAGAPGPRGEQGSRLKTGLDRLAEFDMTALGVPRGKLLERLVSESISSREIIHPDGRLVGYALARAGRRADYLGPVVACNPGTARDMITSILGDLGQDVYWDLMEDNIHAKKLALELGFEKERNLVRMRRGPVVAGENVTYYAISGFETG